MFLKFFFFLLSCYIKFCNLKNRLTDHICNSLKLYYFFKYILHQIILSIFFSMLEFKNTESRACNVDTVTAYCCHWHHIPIGEFDQSNLNEGNILKVQILFRKHFFLKFLTCSFPSVA